MKINVSTRLSDGDSEQYTREDYLDEVPEYAKKLLEIEGVKELYRVINFIALERDPKVSWEEILPKVKQAFGADEESLDPGSERTSAQQTDDAFGEVKVLIQMF